MSLQDIDLNSANTLDFDTIEIPSRCVIVICDGKAKVRELSVWRVQNCYASRQSKADEVGRGGRVLRRNIYLFFYHTLIAIVSGISMVAILWAIITITNKDLIVLSTFLGALLGGIITGGTAIVINIIEINRRKEEKKNERKKAIHQINHFIELVEINFMFLKKLITDFNNLNDPTKDIVIDNNGVASYDELKEYNVQATIINNMAKDHAGELEMEFNQMLLIDISKLDINLMTKLSRGIIKFKVICLPTIKEIQRDGFHGIDGSEIEDIEENIKLLKI